MSITNYTELQVAVKNHLKRNDLTAVIPDYITFGEEWLNNELRSRSMVATADVIPSQSNTYVSLPTGFLEPISFTNDLGDVLRAVSDVELAKASYGASAGRPSCYVLGSRIDFERVADASYTYRMKYWKRLDIATDTTNDVLTNHPNLYVYAALVAATPAIKDDKRIPIWIEYLKNTIRQINRRDARHLKTLRTDFPVRSSFDIQVG